MFALGYKRFFSLGPTRRLSHRLLRVGKIRNHHIESRLSIQYAGWSVQTINASLFSTRPTPDSVPCCPMLVFQSAARTFHSTVVVALLQPPPEVCRRPPPPPPFLAHGEQLLGRWLPK